MKLENKQDLDALLRRWPALAPGKEAGVVEHEDNADWEGRALAIVGAAASAGPAPPNALAALEAPPLPAEAGEPERAEISKAAGEIRMSQEKETGGRKKTSLKAIAERASQSS